MQNRLPARAGVLIRRRRDFWQREHLSIGALDHRNALVADVLHQRHRAQQARGVVDEMEERREAEETKHTGDGEEELTNVRFNLVHRLDGEEERANEEAHRIEAAASFGGPAGLQSDGGRGP